MRAPNILSTDDLTAFRRSADSLTAVGYWPIGDSGEAIELLVALGHAEAFPRLFTSC